MRSGHVGSCGLSGYPLNGYWLPSTVDSASHNITAIAAILAGLAVISGLLWAKKSPFRRCVTWVFARNIGEPFGRNVREYVREANAEDRKLLESSIAGLRDDLAELARTNDSQHGEVARGLAQMHADFNAHLNTFTVHVAATDARHEAHLRDADGKESVVVQSIADIHDEITKLRHDITGENPVT